MLSYQSILGFYFQIDQKPVDTGVDPKVVHNKTSAPFLLIPNGFMLIVFQHSWHLPSIWKKINMIPVHNLYNDDKALLLASIRQMSLA